MLPTCADELSLALATQELYPPRERTSDACQPGHTLRKDVA